MIAKDDLSEKRISGQGGGGGAERSRWGVGRGLKASLGGNCDVDAGPPHQPTPLELLRCAHGFRRAPPLRSVLHVGGDGVDRGCNQCRATRRAGMTSLVLLRMTKTRRARIGQEASREPLVRCKFVSRPANKVVQGQQRSKLLLGQYGHEWQRRRRRRWQRHGGNGCTSAPVARRRHRRSRFSNAVRGREGPRGTRDEAQGEEAQGGTHPDMCDRQESEYPLFFLSPPHSPAATELPKRSSIY